MQLRKPRHIEFNLPQVAELVIGGTRNRTQRCFLMRIIVRLPLLEKLFSLNALQDRPKLYSLITNIPWLTIKILLFVVSMSPF